MNATKENARPVAATTGTGGGNANLVLPSTESMRRVPHSDSTTRRATRQGENQRYATIGDDFQRVKDAVTMPQVAEMYGYTPNQVGKIRCPFHSEKTPSCKIYADHWYCFGACKTGGDAVKFVEKLFSLSPLDAMKRLNEDFSLGLSLDRHAPTPEELDAARRRQEERDAARMFENWRTRAEWALSTAAGIGEAALRDKTPDAWSEAEWLAVRKMAYWDYLRERLYDGGEAERVEILRDWPVVGGDVERVIKAVNLHA